MIVKEVLGFDFRYTVSDSGVVTSYARTPGGKVLRQTKYGTATVYLSVLVTRGGKQVRRSVHTLVLEAFVGPRPEGMLGLHRNGDPFDNRAENLYWGTRFDNAQDMIRHGRHRNARKTHCKEGHEFTEENTYVEPSGVRRCRICLRAKTGRRDKMRLAAYARDRRRRKNL